MLTYAVKLTLIALALSYASAHGDPPKAAKKPEPQPVQPLWRLDVRRDEPAETASGPRLVNDDARVFYLQAGRVRAVDAASGRPLWSRRVGDGAQLRSGPGRLLTITATKIVALEPVTGRVRWARSTREDLYGRLYAVDQHALYIAGSEGLAAIDLETGRTRWTTRVPYFAPFEPFTVVKNRIFVFTVSGDAMSARTSMFDARTGRRLGEADTRGPLAVWQGRMFFQNDWFPLDSPDDVLVNVYDLRTGKPLERRTYSVKNRVTGTYTSSEMAMNSGAISGAIYISGGGNLACFPARQRGGVAEPNFIQVPRGEVAWRAGPRRGVFVLEWRGGVWLVRARRDAPCAPVNLRREGLRLGPGRVARVTFVGRGVYVGLKNGLFYAADGRSNRVLRKFRLPAPAYGPSRVVGDTLIVQAGAELLALAPPD